VDADIPENRYGCTTRLKGSRGKGEGVLTRGDIMRINLAAGLIAGAFLGLGEIAYQEIRTRIHARAVVAEVTEPVSVEPKTDGTGT
jgi:hypothetical protein